MVLRDGGLVAFPTDTLYALGADAFNPIAVERVFAAKGRRWADPIPLLVGDLAMVLALASDLPDVAAPLIESHWPGPLTLLVAAAPNVSRALTASTAKIGVRLPGAPLARELILRLGRPVTGTSANRSGGNDPKDADEVYRQLRHRVDLILDSGPTPLGRPSTVVDLTMTPPHIVREGAIERAGILSLLSAWFRLPSEERAWRARSLKAFGK
jgi:L-threonylcarbamoyladenylate synthase